MITSALKDRKFISLVRMSVAESVQQVLADPDFGLEIKDSFRKRLLKYKNKKSKKFTSLAEIKKRYALD
ncbi:MAG: hypothetical protein V1704_02970 [Candidatus Vogelbacteria bacterium]